MRRDGCLAHCLRQPHRRRAGVKKESKIENTRLVVCSNSKGLGEGELLTVGTTWHVVPTRTCRRRWPSQAWRG
jgi:hypothetical protein